MEETVFGNILNYRSVSVLVVCWLFGPHVKFVFLTLKVTILTINMYF